MGVRKISKPNLNKGEVKRTASPVVEVEPEVEDVMEDEFFDDEVNEFEEEEDMEGLVDEEDVEEEDDFEEVEKVVVKKPVAKKKAVKEVKESKGKEIFQKVETPKELVVEGKVTKRDDLLKIVLEELESKGMTTTLTNLDTVFKAIENAIKFSLDNGAPVFLLGNQITIKERSPRVAIVPKQDYDTFTGAYIAYQWSKLGERETVRGKYNKETKEFTAEDGTVFKLD